MAPIPGGYYAGGHVAPSFTAKTEAACKKECLVSPQLASIPLYLYTSRLAPQLDGVPLRYRPRFGSGPRLNVGAQGITACMQATWAKTPPPAHGTMQFISGGYFDRGAVRCHNAAGIWVAFFSR